MSAILEFSAVSVRYKGRWALQDVDLACEAGVLTGIVGPNGAGKTTLMRAALGLTAVAGGTVRIQGKPSSSWRREALARTLAYLPQGGEACWPMRAADVVMLGRLPHRPAFAAPQAADAAAVRAALERCDATIFAERKMNALSAGERARVLLARALATQAAILMADEPAAFLDPAHQFALMDILKAEAARGAAVLVSLHDLSLAQGCCDRLIVLDAGQVAAAGPPATTLTEEILADVFGIAFTAPATGERRRPPFRKI